MAITVPEEISTLYRRIGRTDQTFEFSTDFMRPFDMCDGLFLRLAVGATPTCFLAVAPTRSRPFETAGRSASSAGVAHTTAVRRTVL